MRAIWKGAVSFGLVSVPVKLYSATESHDVSFRQVHAKDGGRIKYQRVCSIDGEEVAYADIAKGYETEDGEMVILTDDDLAELPSTSSREISVEKFVPSDQIDPMLFEKSYYLEPEKTGAKPYALLRQALLDADRMAVVTVALRQRTSVAVLRVRDDVIVLQTMMWPDEIRTPDFSIEAGDVKPAEVKMANMLVETLAGDFDAAEFEDDYAGAVEALVKTKIEGGEVKRTETSTKTSGEVVDLLAALQRSVDAAKTSRGEASDDADAGRRGDREADEEGAREEGRDQEGSCEEGAGEEGSRQEDPGQEGELTWTTHAPSRDGRSGSTCSPRTRSAAQRFYGGLFGWTAHDTGPEYGGYLLFERDGVPVAGCMRNDGSSGSPDAWTVYLESNNASDTARMAEANGGQVLVEAMQVGDLGHMAVVKDPGRRHDRHLAAASSTAGSPAAGATGSRCGSRWPPPTTRRAIAFYENVFGWVTHTMVDSPELRYTTLGRDDDALAGIMAAPAGPGLPPPAWDFYIDVTDTDATVDQAVAAGATVTTPAEDTPYGRLAALTDPTGARFLLMGPNT